ncbi:MAG: hypothetical protein RLZZ440_495 [Planctomycetota bacterium]|jgi:hypothetical protein
MNTPISRLLPRLLVVFAVAGLAASADAQVVYYSALRPVVAAPVVAAPVAPAYVANYTPAGNYAAVTAYSPPVVAPSSAVAVTSSYAPAATPVAVTSFYAPAATAVPVTSYYAPATVAYSPVVAAAPVVAAPVTTYYAPTAVVAPMYRRGLFGALRPVRNAYYIAY